MKFIAALLTLYILGAWVVLYPSRFSRAFLLPAACVSTLVVFQIVYAFRTENTAQIGRLVAGFLMMSLLVFLVSRPRRTTLWILVAWLGFSLIGNVTLSLRAPSPNLLAFNAVEILAIGSLAYIGIFVRSVLDPAKDVGAVFD